MRLDMWNLFSMVLAECAAGLRVAILSLSGGEILAFVPEFNTYLLQACITALITF